MEMYNDNALHISEPAGIRIFPGIGLTYLDIDEPDAEVRRESVRDRLEIDYCRSGRAEFRVGSDFYYLSEGDLSVTRRTGAGVSVDFPLGRYTGVTISVDLAQTPMRFSGILDDVNVEPRLLCEKYGSAFRIERFLLRKCIARRNDLIPDRGHLRQIGFRIRSDYH